MVTCPFRIAREDCVLATSFLPLFYHSWGVYAHTSPMSLQETPGLLDIPLGEKDYNTNNPPWYRDRSNAHPFNLSDKITVGLCFSHILCS